MSLPIHQASGSYPEPRVNAQRLLYSAGSPTERDSRNYVRTLDFVEGRPRSQGPMAAWQRQHQLPVVGDRDFGGAPWHRPDTRHNLTHSHATIAASPIALREAPMLNTYERHVITGYLSNMANRFGRESPEAGRIVEWLTENAGLLGFDRRSFDLDSEPFDSKEEMSAKQWRVCRRILDQAAESTAAVRYDRLMRRLRRLGRIIKLSAEGRHEQGVHEPSSGGQRVADAMDHQRSPRQERHHSAAHDLCAGNAPAAAAHPDTDLGASTGAA